MGLTHYGHMMAYVTSTHDSAAFKVVNATTAAPDLAVRVDTGRNQYHYYSFQHQGWKDPLTSARGLALKSA